MGACALCQDRDHGTFENRSTLQAVRVHPVQTDRPAVIKTLLRTQAPPLTDSDGLQDKRKETAGDIRPGQVNTTEKGQRTHVSKEDKGQRHDVSKEDKGQRTDVSKADKRQRTDVSKEDKRRRTDMSKEEEAWLEKERSVHPARKGVLMTTHSLFDPPDVLL